MPITLPAAVAANELIQSSWGNSVRNAVDYLDDNKLDNFQSDTMVGTLTLAPTATNLSLILKGGSETPTLQWQSIAGSVLLEIQATASAVTVDTLSSNPITISAATTINSPSASKALILKAVTETPQLSLESIAGTQNCTLTAGAATSTLAHPGGDLAFSTNGTERARFLVGGTWLLGKTTSDLSVIGLEVFTSGGSTGSLRSTISAASIMNSYMRHEGAADANGEDFCQFLRGSTVIGSIDQNSTTGVNFNTTSDERLKTDIGLAIGDGIGTISQITVRRYSQDDSEGIGVFAQELNDVIPSAVKVGGADPLTDPWQVAYSGHEIIAHLLLAVQQIAARVDDLEAAP